MSVAELELVKSKVEEVEVSPAQHHLPGGATELLRKLDPRLRRFETRSQLFLDLAYQLNSIGRQIQAVAPAAEVLIQELNRRTWDAAHILDVVVDDDKTPPEVTQGAINFVAGDPKLMSSPLIEEALTVLAIHDEDSATRRLAWLRLCMHYAQNPPLSGSGGSESNPKFSRDALRRQRREFISRRNALGPRGSILQAADVYRDQGQTILELLTALARPADVDRKETALLISELGGTEVASHLAVALKAEIREHGVNESYQVSLASALANLGGPEAVESLLRAAEEGPERVRLAALAGLESLATAGSIALTEYPEPAIIDSEEMRNAYVALAQRVSTLVDMPTTPPYVRHKATELLDSVTISLRSAHVLA